MKDKDLSANIAKLVNGIISIGFKDVTKDRLILMGDVFHKENCSTYFFEKEDNLIRIVLSLTVDYTRVDFEGMVFNKFNFAHRHYSMIEYLGNGPDLLVRQFQEMIELATK